MELIKGIRARRRTPINITPSKPRTVKQKGIARVRNIDAMIARMTPEEARRILSEIKGGDNE